MDMTGASLDSNAVASLNFPSKLWHLATNDTTGSIWWSSDGDFVIIDTQKFETNYLKTRVFKTEQLDSIVRQFNLYNFLQFGRTIKIRDVANSGDTVASLRVYSSPYFKRDSPHLLPLIKRAGNSSRLNGRRPGPRSLATQRPNGVSAPVTSLGGCGGTPQEMPSPLAGDSAFFAGSNSPASTSLNTTTINNNSVWNPPVGTQTAHLLNAKGGNRKRKHGGTQQTLHHQQIPLQNFLNVNNNSSLSAALLNEQLLKTGQVQSGIANTTPQINIDTAFLSRPDSNDDESESHQQQQQQQQQQRSQQHFLKQQHQTQSQMQQAQQQSRQKTLDLINSVLMSTRSQLPNNNQTNSPMDIPKSQNGSGQDMLSPEVNGLQGLLLANGHRNMDESSPRGSTASHVGPFPHSLLTDMKFLQELQKSSYHQNNVFNGNRAGAKSGNGNESQANGGDQGAVGNIQPDNANERVTSSGAASTSSHISNSSASNVIIEKPMQNFNFNNPSMTDLLAAFALSSGLNLPGGNPKINHQLNRLANPTTLSNLGLLAGALCNKNMVNNNNNNNNIKGSNSVNGDDENNNNKTYNSTTNNVNPKIQSASNNDNQTDPNNNSYGNMELLKLITGGTAAMPPPSLGGPNPALAGLLAVNKGNFAWMSSQLHDASEASNSPSSELQNDNDNDDDANVDIEAPCEMEVDSSTPDGVEPMSGSCDEKSSGNNDSPSSPQSIGSSSGTHVSSSTVSRRKSNQPRHITSLAAV